MSELKQLHKDAIPAALEKAERYRLLNEPGEAESICLDVLTVNPDNQRAIIVLLLALTDRFDKGYGVSETQTKELLARDLANPPMLEMIGQEVGCSPFYLSRIFSREVGLTIPQYLRNLRMERAAELLRTGRYNVTEAATEVGYSSLSHFSKAFCETIGCCPVFYPAAKNVILDR